MLLAIKNKDRCYEWAYGPGAQHFQQNTRSMVMAIEYPPNILADNSERQHYDSLCLTVVPELAVQHV